MDINNSKEAITHAIFSVRQLWSSRELSLVITKLEEAILWLSKHEEVIQTPTLDTN